MKKIFSQPNLEEHLWKAAVLLRGGMDSGEYKNIIFPDPFPQKICRIPMTHLRRGSFSFALGPLLPWPGAETCRRQLG